MLRRDGQRRALRFVRVEKGLGKVIGHRDSLDWTLVVGAGKVNMPINSLTW